jgi:hypothetical protein
VTGGGGVVRQHAAEEYESHCYDQHLRRQQVGACV